MNPVTSTIHRFSEHVVKLSFETIITYALIALSVTVLALQILYYTFFSNIGNFNSVFMETATTITNFEFFRLSKIEILFLILGIFVGRELKNDSNR